MAAVFTYLATDIMGTGISEERRLKKAVLQYKNLVITNNDPVALAFKKSVRASAFTFRRSPIKEILNSEGLSNFAILVLFNMLFFVTAYVAFLRYDVR